MAKAAPEPEKTAAEGEATPAKAASPWPALIAVIVLMPAISYATAEFLLLPKLRGLLSTEAVQTSGAKPEKKEAAHAAPAKGGHGAAAKSKGGHGGGHGKSEEGAGEASYDFENVIVNLSGSMGTRYLKTSFTTLGSNPELSSIMTENKKQLLDVTISVLSSRSLADLEAPGAKNIVRNDLLANLNQALKSDVVEQIYFTEFVVQ